MPTPIVGNGFGNSLEAIVATLDDVHTLQHELGVILKQEARNSPTQQPLASPRDYDKTDTDSENDSDGAAQDPDRTFVVDSPERWLRAAAQHVFKLGVDRRNWLLSAGLAERLLHFARVRGQRRRGGSAVLLEEVVDRARGPLDDDRGVAIRPATGGARAAEIKESERRR